MSNSQQKQALLWRLRLIFLYYSSYADRNNYKFLKSQNYRRFLIDSESVTNNSSFPSFDIAFRKIHSSSITLTQFQDLFPIIAQLIYPNKNRKEAFNLFMGLHIEKLYNQILAHSQFGSDIVALQTLEVQKASLEMLDTIPLHKAYQKYIESTSMHQKQPEQTFEQVHLFLSDFQVSPKLVYKALVYLAFFQLLRVNKSQSWGLLDLQKLIILIAELYWKRIEEKNSNQQDKIYRLLQHMQTSEGFKKMVDKTLKQNGVLVSFFKKPTRLATQMRYSRENQRRLDGSLQKSPPPTTKNLEGSRYFSAKRQRYANIGPVKDLLDEENNVALKMREIFQRLCSHGQVGNNHTLKSIKIKKYFSSLNILTPLEQTWVDITISDLCRTSQSGKIQFSHFLQLLHLAAEKLKIAPEALFHYLIDKSTKQPINSSNYFSAQKTSREVEHDSAIQVLYQVEKQLEKIYIYYKAGQKGLSFSQISHLLFQFDIFPTFVNKVKLYNHFQIRSKASTTLKKLVGEVLLDLRGYLQILADISHQIGDNLSEQERVLFLLERMQDSQGHKKVLGTQGSNLIGDLRSKYAQLYKRKLTKESPKQEGFDELLANYEII